MKEARKFILFYFTVISVHVISSCNKEDDVQSGDPEIPRIDFVEMVENQPHQNDPDVIWYDDFSTEKDYFESRGEIDKEVFLGIDGGSADFGFDKGDVSGRGDRKVAFGDFPGGQPVVRAGEKFEDVYWRIYVKHEYGWRGIPDKMSRATSIVSESWQQAMISHVWSGADNTLTLDPASGVAGHTDQIATTGYNDFDNLTWLGNRPTSNFQITSSEESGYWVLVEARAKLNTPGMADGVNQLWIDGRQEAERTELNFRGRYTGHGLNALFLESYWNEGAVKTEGRWFDNFVISTKPIGPLVSPKNPILYKTPYQGEGELAAWVVELASDFNADDVVFSSNELGLVENVVIDESNGAFKGSLKGKASLISGQVYYGRVRQQNSSGIWSEWSRWHQPFKVE